MEGSDGNECSKAWPSDQNEEEEESDINEKRIMASDHGSGSSSNSTIEENDQKKSSSSTVRPYVRSKTPRLRWTQDLHQRFVQAVERLGGQERATPKLVLQLMNVKGLNIAHIKSHLQMYRSKKIDDPTQVISDHRNFVDGGDRNIYNLSQLPMLQSYNQTYNPCSLRYGDIAPWNVGLQKRMQSSFMSRSALENVRPTFYSSVSERIFGRNQTNRDAHVHLSSSSDQFSTWKTHARKYGLGGSIHNLERRRQQDHKSLINPMELSSFITVEATVPQLPLHLEATNLQKHTTTAKRKLSTCDLDLNLTLGVKSKNDDDDDDDNWEVGQQWEDENKTLSLSLYSQSSSKKVRRWKEVDREEDGGRASTLDLTI